MREWLSIRQTVTEEGNRFFSELDRPAEIQDAVLGEILEKNANTEYGRQHRFSSIKSISMKATCNSER